MKYLRLALLGFLTAGVLLAPRAAQADANTAPINGAYNNRIIDDSVFLSSGSMSAQDIQAFLNSKVPTCSPDPNPALRRACLKDYVDPAVGKSAAQIIFDVSQAVNINPKVILVTLQKEQSLVTDPTPWPSQYDSAMGYGCPESQSVCNAQYYGFYNQVNLGSRLLRAGTARNCGDTGTLSGWWISPQWRLGASPAIDGRATTLQTCASGALYNYTPHRPDSAWIPYNGTYFYGNYNFINTFNKWFGSTWATAYSAQYAGQSNPTPMLAGETRQVSLTYTNTGGQTWYQDTFHLGTQNPLDRASAFAGGTGWLSNSRIRMQEATVAPGQQAHFVFTLTGNVPLGNYHEHFRPLVEGVQWLEDFGVFFPVFVARAPYSADVAAVNTPDMLNANRQGEAVLKVRNMGTTDLPRGTFHLGTCQPADHASALYTAGSWLSPERVPMEDDIVPPGGTGTFRFTVTAPQVGRFTETLCPVLEGITWYDNAMTFTVETGGTYAMEYVGQSAPPLILPGQTASQYIEMKNTGTATWYNDGPKAVRLGTNAPRDHASSLFSGWAAPNRIAMDQPAVSPGQTARFSFNVAGPPAGDYRLYLQPLAEMRGWFGFENYIFLPVNTVPRYGANWVSQDVSAGPLSVGQTRTATIRLRNTGNQPWQKTGTNPVRLGTANPLDRVSSFFTADNWLNDRRVEAQESTVAPGAIGTFTFTLTPSKAGDFKEYFRPVVEGSHWLPDWGIYLPLTVNS